METVYYTVYVRAKASGGEDRVYTAVMTQAPRELPPLRNNVISLDAYRARLAEEAPAEPDGMELEGSEESKRSAFAYESFRPSARLSCAAHGRTGSAPCMPPPAPGFAIPPRRRLADALLWGAELLACAALIAVAAACAVFLL